MIGVLSAIVAVATIATTSAHQLVVHNDVLEPVSERCVALSGVNPLEATGVFNGNFPNDIRLKKYFECCAKSVNIMDSQGNLIPQNIPLYLRHYRGITDPVVLSEIENRCGYFHAGSPEETAFLFTKCKYSVFFAHHAVFVPRPTIW